MTGITAIKVVTKYLEHFPALGPLTLIVKSYLNQRGMNEVYKGGLGSYSIMCMVISFLQVGIRCPTPKTIIKPLFTIDAPQNKTR